MHYILIENPVFGLAICVFTPSFIVRRLGKLLFNSQYPNLTVKHMTAFHDRFLILDDTVGYHVGASLKDAGKKCFGISLIQDEQTIQDILNRL